MLQVCDREVTMFRVVLRHSRVMAHGLRVFFHIVHRVVIHGSGGCNGVANMFGKVNTIATNLPGAAVIRG